MKKRILLLLAALLLCGCTPEESANMENSGEITESKEIAETGDIAENEEITESGDTAETGETAAAEVPPEETKPEEEAQISLPDMVLSLRRVDEAELPDGLTEDAAFLETVARAIYEQTEGLGISVRIPAIIPTPGAYYIEYEAFPRGERCCMDTYLGRTLQVCVNETDGVYSIGQPAMIDTDGLNTLRTSLVEYRKNENTVMENGIFLEDGSRICLVIDGEVIRTDLSFRAGIEWLGDLVVTAKEGDTIVVVSSEDRYYETGFSVSVSRDGGGTWTTTVPELAPLGQNGQHAEKGFTACRIQIREDGSVYIFTGTNLASMTVLKVPADSHEAQVLFREQIGGYETTSLADAAMVTETRGYYTLAHPKYAASNAIYRTTDGGETWVRCSVPMPEGCEDPWEMKLCMPEAVTEWLEWRMKGVWDTGECTYASYDGGWTWEIVG